MHIDFINGLMAKDAEELCICTHTFYSVSGGGECSFRLHIDDFLSIGLLL